MSEHTLRCRIHRGCHEIGGNCIELESGGKRLILDLGLPLQSTNTDLPQIAGLRTEDETLLGIFISHPHPDHYGLLEQVKTSVPVYLGQAAARIIETSSYFTRLPTLGSVQQRTYHDQTPIELGPFTVTPLRIDHSAYDSYCLLVEVAGKRVLYTGDLRGHGRLRDKFQQLITGPLPRIDVLICEGTQIGRIANFAYPDEASVADAMTNVFRQTRGMCLVWCSSQNIDRLASVWQACQAAGRDLILDLYTADILKVVSDAALPRPGQSGVHVYLPYTVKQKIKRDKAFHRVAPYKPYRIYPEDLSTAASHSVILFRDSMLEDLKRADCLEDACLITSLWSGYLDRSSSRLNEIHALKIQQHHIHTSGHASEEKLRQFIAAFPASRIIPIHLENREAFARIAPRVELKADGDWWEV